MSGLELKDVKHTLYSFCQSLRAIKNLRQLSETCPAEGQNKCTFSQITFMYISVYFAFNVMCILSLQPLYYGLGGYGWD